MLSILDLKPLPEENTRTGQDAAPSVEASRIPEPAIAAERVSSPAPKSSEPGKPASSATRPGIPVSEPINIPESVPEPIAEPPSAEAELPTEQGEYELVLGRRQIASWLFVGTVLIAIFSAAAYYVGRMTAPDCLAELKGQSTPYVAPPLPEASIVVPGRDPNPPVSLPADLPGDMGGALAAKPAPSGPVAQTPVAPTAPVAASFSPAASARSISPPASAPASVSASGLPKSAVSVYAPEPRGPAFSAESAGAATVASAPTAPPPVYAGHPASAEPPLFANPQPGALYLQMGAVEKGIAVVLAEGLRRHGFSSLVAPGPNEKIFRVLIGPFTKQEDYKRAKAEIDAIDLGTFARRFQK